MSTLICVSGTPGAGKSTLALALCSKFGWTHIDIHDLEKECGEFNFDKDCYDLDMSKVEEHVSQVVLGGDEEQVFVFDTHVSHLLESGLVDLCIIVRCANLKLLKSRLEARDYSESKVAENLECEIMEVCLDEARDNLGSKGVFVLEIDGSGEGYPLDVLESVKKLI